VRVILTGQYLYTDQTTQIFSPSKTKIFLVLHGFGKKTVSSQNIFISGNILDSDNIFTLSPRPQNLNQKKRPYRSTSKKT